MIGILKNKSIGCYLELLAAVLAIVTVIMGATGNALLNNASFDAFMIVIMSLGAVLAIAGFFVKFDFWLLLPAICFFIGFGMIVNGGAAVIMDKINNVVYSGGNFNAVVSYLIMMGVSCILSIVACFMKSKRS